MSGCAAGIGRGTLVCCPHISHGWTKSWYPKIPRNGLGQLNQRRSCSEKPQLLSEHGLWMSERDSGFTNTPKPWHSCAQLCCGVGMCLPSLWRGRWAGAAHHRRTRTAPERIWAFGVHPCMGAKALPVDALHVWMVPKLVAQPTCWWSLDASQVNPLSAFQGQAVGTQIFAHPEKLPHTLQLAEVLVLRRQETGIQDKPCCAMGSSGRGSPC